MVVNNLNFKRITITPNEANTILIVDADAVLTFPITLQGFEMIAWKDCQISQLTSSV